MKRLIFFLVLLGLFSGVGRAAEPIAIELKNGAGNWLALKMGDRVEFESVITNAGSVPVEGLVAWISLVEVTPGREQPMDLEDWSAHKAVTRARLAPGESLKTRWPMRLIQAGDFRVVISAVARKTDRIATSPFLDFHVELKPVVESTRILPVAFGVPLLIGVLAVWRLWGRRRFPSARF
jgi:hypothetical protein